MVAGKNINIDAATIKFPNPFSHTMLNFNPVQMYIKLQTIQWGPWGPFLGYIILYISKRVPKVPRRNSAVKRSPEVPTGPQGPHLGVQHLESVITECAKRELRSEVGTFCRHIILKYNPV